MERDPELIADSQDTVLPTVDVVFPYEKLSTPFAKAIKTYLVLDEEALLKAAKEAAIATDNDNKFLDVKFEDLFNIPVTDGNAYNAKVAQYAKEGRVDSSGSQLAVVSIDIENKMFEAPNMINSVPAPLTTLSAYPATYVQSPPTVTTNPQYGLPTAPAINNTNILETLLNTQVAITISGNIFSKGASFGPSGGSIINTFFALPVRSGSSEDRTAPSLVILNTAEGNHLNLYLATANGHQIGDYEYILEHAVPHLLNDPEFDVVQIGPTKFLDDNFVYSVTNSYLETNIGTLTFQIVDDVPIATNQSGGTVTEANIITIGTAQSNVPATLVGSLISPPINRFGADGGTVSNVTVPNGTTQFVFGSINVLTAEGNTLTVDQATGNYVYTLENSLQHNNNLPINEVFTYEFTDGDGSVASANLTITINDDIPIANAKTNSASESLYFVNGSESVTGNLLTDDNGFGISLFGADGGVISSVFGATDASDGQVDGIIEVATDYGDITVYITQQGAHQIGDYEYRLDGAKTVVANDNLITVMDTISYVLTDNDGSVDNADLSITISLNQAPTAVDDSGQTDENIVLNVLAVNGVLINDTDPDPGDTKWVSAVEGNALNVGVPFALLSNALLQLDADGAYSYDPNGAFNTLAIGSQTTDTFSYTMRDAEGLTSDATVTITIDGVNTAPVAVDDSNTTNGNIVIDVNTVNDPNNLLINDTDDVGDTFVISAVNSLAGNVGVQIALASGALLTVNADGTYQYDPNNAFVVTDTDSFTYEITDNHGLTSNVATVTINVIVPPIILDLQDDGIQLISPIESQVSFTILGRDKPTTMGWVSGEDGILAIDLNGDRIINGLEEFTFTHPNAQTDLEALRLRYDSNFDGILDMNDDDWLRFGLWQDQNENGLCEPGEFQSLAERGIAEISLKSDEQQLMVEGNIIFGFSHYQTVDGQIHQLADVGFGI